MSLEIKPYDGSLKEKMISTCGKHLVEVSAEKYILTLSYKDWQEKFLKFKTKSDDVWVVSYPKAGTTWAQEMVWRILNDDQSIQKTDQKMIERFPFFEWELLCSEDSTKGKTKDDDPRTKGAVWKRLQCMENSPRTIKSHLHLDLLPSDILSSDAKIVYICRDPRDVCVSYYYHTIRLTGNEDTFQDFFELFINDLHMWSPFWKHILDFWKRRESSNILFLRYEEMQEDLPKVIGKVADFLGKSLNNDYVEGLTDHLSFSKMSLNTTANNEDIPVFDPEKVKFKFMRKGTVGDWKSHFTSENKVAYKKWTEEKLKGSDFPYYRDYE